MLFIGKTTRDASDSRFQDIDKGKVRPEPETRALQ